MRASSNNGETHKERPPGDQHPGGSVRMGTRERRAHVARTKEVVNKLGTASLHRYSTREDHGRWKSTTINYGESNSNLQ